MLPAIQGRWNIGRNLKPIQLPKNAAATQIQADILPEASAEK